MNPLELGKTVGVNPMFQAMYAFGTIDSVLGKLDEYFSNPMKYSSFVHKLGQCGIDKEFVDSMHVAKDFINKIVEDNTNK